MKNYLFKKLFSIFFVLAFIACEPNEDNNEALDYDKLSVNFSINTADFDMPENAAYGIAAYCTRNNQDGVQMNEMKKISVYNSINSGTFSNLIKALDSDMIETLKNDRSFIFYAVYPYKADIDFQAVEANVPAIQNYEDGVNAYLTFTAHTQVTSIVPTTAFAMTTPFAVLNLSVPLDIIEEGTPSTLKSITITPAKAEKFSGALSGGGTVNAETGVFTVSTTTTSTSIRLNFPAEGLKLREAKTVIPVAVLPFNVPEGGFDIEFEGINGISNSTPFLNQTSDAGTTIKAGSNTTVTISHSADGVIPVSFPVVFPLGKVDGVARFTSALQPNWLTSGLWSCQAQPQAYAQWNSVSTPSDTYKFWHEIVNTGDISTPGIKGVWTNDYLEFVIPAKKIPANQKITWKFPFYGREQPVFWNIKYLDGEEWKTFNLHEETCSDGVTKMNCTFSMERDVIKICSFTMTLQNEVKSGYLKFRLECADGSIQNRPNGVVLKDCTTPWVDAGKYQAPCYFRTDRGAALKEISFLLE